MLSHSRARIFEEEAVSTLPDFVLATMIEERTIEGPDKPPHPVVERQPRRWSLLAMALLVSLLAAAIIAFP